MSQWRHAFGTLQRLLRVSQSELRCSPRASPPCTQVTHAAVRRFGGNDDCVESWRRFLCYLNFPRCDTQQESLMLCRSVCVNFFKACKYPKDMERCVPQNGKATNVASAAAALKPTAINLGAQLHCHRQPSVSAPFLIAQVLRPCELWRNGAGGQRSTRR